MADDPRQQSTLSQSLRTALKDCAGYSVYWWKPKAMEKLATLGLVERLPHHDRAGQLAYGITEAGQEVLADG